MTKTYKGSKLPFIKTLLFSCVAAVVLFFVVGVMTYKMVPALIAGIACFIMLFFVVLRDGLNSLYNKVVLTDTSLTIYGFHTCQEYLFNEYELFATSVDNERRNLQASRIKEIAMPVDVHTNFLSAADYKMLQKDLGIKPGKH